MPGEHPRGKEAGDARANHDRMVAHDLGSHHQLRPIADGAGPGAAVRMQCTMTQRRSSRTGSAVSTNILAASGIRTISVPPSGSVWTLDRAKSTLSRSVAQTII